MINSRRGAYQQDNSFNEESPSDINIQDLNVYKFKKGDLVTPYYAPGNDFYGVVIDVNQKENRVYVDFSGTIRQMDPDEIRIVLKQKIFEASVDARRGKKLEASKKKAIYHCGRGRKYKYTRNELNSGKAFCPLCKNEMEQIGFKRNVKLYQCNGCGFKIPTDDMIGNE